jgi:hypothetical protein
MLKTKGQIAQNRIKITKNGKEYPASGKSNDKAQMPNGYQSSGFWYFGI